MTTQITPTIMGRDVVAERTHPSLISLDPARTQMTREQAIAGLNSSKAKLLAEEATRTARRKQLSALAAKTNASALDLRQKDPKIRQAITEARQMITGMSKSTVPIMLTGRQPMHVPPSNFDPQTGGGQSISGSQVPYWGYTWNYVDGNADDNGTASSDGSLSMTAAADAEGDDYGQCSAQAFQGFYFAPADVSSVQVGVATVSAVVPYSFLYTCIGDFSNAWTSIWMGLRIEEFDLNANWIQTVVDQRISLVDDHSYLSADTDNQSNSGLPLGAWFFGNNANFYNIWVQCYAHAHGSGQSLFTASFASASLSVTVPSIHWQYFGI